MDEDLKKVEGLNSHEENTNSHEGESNAREENTNSYEEKINAPEGNKNTPGEESNTPGENKNVHEEESNTPGENTNSHEENTNSHEEKINAPEGNKNVPYEGGWEIVRFLNGRMGKASAVEMRRTLAEYFKLNTRRPSKLHSAVLSVAVKMAINYPEFHFVPFLNLWGLENLRPEDSLPQDLSVQANSMQNRNPQNVGGTPSRQLAPLVARMAKAYVYSLLFHPDEHLDPALENIIAPFISKHGYSLSKPSVTLAATKVSTSDAHGKKLTFAHLAAPDGTEYTTEIHTLTSYKWLRHEEIPERLFDVLLKSPEKETANTTPYGTPNGNPNSTPYGPPNGNGDGRKAHIVAAVLSTKHIKDVFPCGVGYVDHIDRKNRHIHIFDSESRHFVAGLHPIAANGAVSQSEEKGGSARLSSGEYAKQLLESWPKEGDFVDFAMIIPKESRFKSAIINRVYQNDEGSETFGYRKAKVTFTDANRGYCAWELLPSEPPIVEAGTDTPSFRTGFVSVRTLQQANRGGEETLPEEGRELRIIVYLKRGKGGQKRPFVAKVEW